MIAATYYVDPAGDDANDGGSPQHAWRTLLRVSTGNFRPADRIRLRSGGHWRETLNIRFSGTAAAPIVVESFGEGPGLPIVSGADVVSHDAPRAATNGISVVVWPGDPDQIFFDGIRGNRVAEPTLVRGSGDWCAFRGGLHYRAVGPQTVVEAASRPHAVEITGSYVVVIGLQVERTVGSAVEIAPRCAGVTLDRLWVRQWSDATEPRIGGVVNRGASTTIAGSTFGGTTGDELADQNWAGYIPIVSSGANVRIMGNRIFHNSTENESDRGRFACGIWIAPGSTGRTEVAENLVSHVGGNAILVSGTRSAAGDRMLIHHNTVEYAGQAGIALYKTRVPLTAHTSAEGHVYANLVSHANRLGGAKGGGYVDVKKQGNRAGGIHFNDGVENGIEANAPFLRWFCYDNEVRHTSSPGERASPDSDGIAIDYNANGVQVYRNRIHDCDGKGIYIWNADRCRVFYNIVYGNDVGIVVTASGPAAKTGAESADDNIISNNTLYRNYNGQGIGKDYHAEIYFGLKGNRNVFKNNIVFASSGDRGTGVAYRFDPRGSTGCGVDYNLVYAEAGADAKICLDGSAAGPKTFAAWQADHGDWDRHSVFGDPRFGDAAAGNFALAGHSPAIDRGVDLGDRTDFAGAPVRSAPDVGALEEQDSSDARPGCPAPPQGR